MVKGLVRRWLHRISLILLVSGFAFYCYGLYAGAGLSGWLQRWQIETHGWLGVGYWEAVGFLVLVVAPFVLLQKTEEKSNPLPSDSLPMGGFLSILAVLGLLSFGGYWVGAQGPDLAAKPVLVTVEDTSGDLRDGMARLGGVAQHQMRLTYRALWHLGRGNTSKTQSAFRSLVPVTSAAWHQGQPVQFLIANQRDSLGPGELPSGVMQRNALPWYLRSLLLKKGITLTEPYYVVDTNSYLASKGEWDAIAVISGFFFILLLFVFIGIFWPFADLRTRMGWMRRS